jgi:hypothetical protein
VASAATVWRSPGKDILRYRKRAEKTGLLVHGRDAKRSRIRWATEAPCCSPQVDDSGVGLLRAGKNTEQRTFTGTILADHSMHLSRIQYKIDALERVNTRERFANTAKDDRLSRYSRYCQPP